MDKKQKYGVLFVGAGAFLPPHSGSGETSPKFVKGKKEITRVEKSELELNIANKILESINLTGKVKISNVHSNPTDPPDVLFLNNDEQYGVEVSELVIDNRLEKDAIIDRTKKGIIENLEFNENTKNLVVSITLGNDYTEHLKVSGVPKIIAKFIVDQLNLNPNPDLMCLIPETNLYIQMYKGDLSGDARISRINEPLIVFTAQTQHFIPDDDIPVMVNSRLKDKCTQSLAFPTWLLLWSDNIALLTFEDQIVSVIRDYLESNYCPYQLIIYCSLPKNGCRVIFKNTDTNLAWLK